MRQTAKYVAAIAYAHRLGMRTARNISHQALYDTLEGAGHSWDPAAQQWTDTPAVNSVFGSDDIPASIVKIRLMAHPSVIERITKIAQEYLAGADWEIIEQSSPYPNRRGIGVRVYLTFKV